MFHGENTRILLFAIAKILETSVLSFVSPKLLIKIGNYKKILLGKAKEGDFIYLRPTIQPYKFHGIFYKVYKYWIQL